MADRLLVSDWLIKPVKIPKRHLLHDDLNEVATPSSKRDNFFLSNKELCSKRQESRLLAIYELIYIYELQ